MDEELREAERKWKAFYEGRQYTGPLIRPTDEHGNVNADWEGAYEDKSLNGGHNNYRQTTWGNPKAAEKAAARYARRQGLKAGEYAIKVIHIGNYKFQPRITRVLGRLRFIV